MSVVQRGLHILLMHRHRRENFNMRTMANTIAAANAGFLSLAAVAAAALGILFFFMPETRDKRFMNPTRGVTIQ